MNLYNTLCSIYKLNNYNKVEISELIKMHLYVFFTDFVTQIKVAWRADGGEGGYMTCIHHKMQLLACADVC